MRIARDDGGIGAELAAIASQVHPVFMLPPIAASWFGGLLAARHLDPTAVAWTAAALHSIAIFLAVYTAHVKDGYVDFHVRDEDDEHPVTDSGCRLLLAGASLGFFLVLGGLWRVVGIDAALVTVPTWLIGYHHAPQLDTDPVGATTGYPLGVAISLVGGYVVQAAAVTPIALAFALVFLVLLSGVKVIDDAQDYDYDRSAAKRTVAVVLGPRRARRVAYGLMALALVSVVAFAAARLFPSGAVLAALAFGVVAFATRRAGPELATMLLVRGSYVFLAILVAAVWFRPLASL